MDVIPGRLPVTEALDVFDRDVGLRRVAEDGGQEVVLAPHLGLLVPRVVEDLAVHVAEDVVADPAHHFEVPGGEHRRQDTLEERFTGLAVAAGVGDPPLAGRLLERFGRGARRRREVDVGRAGLERGQGIEAAGRQRTGQRVVEQRFEFCERLWDRQRRRRLGGGDVDHHHVAETVGTGEGLDIGPHAVDRLSGSLHAGRDRVVGQFTDLVARGHDRARPQAAFRLGEEVGGTVEQFRHDRAAVGPHAAGLVGQPARPDVVAAHDDVSEVDQVDPGEGIERGDEPHRLDRAAGQVCQPRDRGGGHAPLGPDEPQTDTAA